LLFSGNLWAQATNLELLTQLADSLVGSFLAREVGETSLSVLLEKSDATNGSNWFLEARLVDACQRRNHTVFISGAENSTHPVDAYLLRFNGLDVGASYTDLHNDPTHLRRKAAVKMAVILSRVRSGEVLWQGNLAAHHSDRINRKQVEALENSNIPFTVGSRERQSKPVRWVQPVAVSATAGLVIFLFYSLRSR